MPMAMAAGAGQDGEWYTADLGNGKKDELFSEKLDGPTAAGSRGGRLTSMPRKG